LAVTAMRIPTPSSFDTHRVMSEVVGEQVREWEVHNAASLVALACDAPADRPFEALEVNLQLPQIHLALVRGSRHVVGRTEALVESNPTDAIAVYAALRGEAMLEYAGRRRALHPGQLMVCDADRPFVRGFGHGLEELAVKIPRQAFAETTGQETVGTPIVIDAGPDDDLYGRALVRLVGRALRCAHPVPADEQAVVELVSVLANPRRTNLAVAHRAAARAFIEEQFHDAGLLAADVAAAIGVSERTLSRVFAATGISVPQHILSRRLDAAYGVLSSPLAERLRTTDVAAGCGFSSMAYFSQTFRKRFGITAGEVRRAALA